MTDTPATPDSAGNGQPEPVVADRRPKKLTLEPGTYYWCRCGRSQNQPFCDGSHEGTGFEPVEFTIDETRTVRLCLCKHTDNQPFCDGAHFRF